MIESDRPAQTPREFAFRLEHFASRVRAIRPVDHRRPDIFFEDQSEVIAALMAEARALRTAPAAPKLPLPVLRPGSVEVGRRSVTVEVRGRRRA